jgi:hypothetical protein
MPNARYLAVGDKIRNLTTNQVYVIAEVMNPAKYIPNPEGNIIRLDSTGVVKPKEEDLLILPEESLVNFQTSYSRYYQDRPLANWRDTIIYRIKRREPGTIGKHPFDPPTEIKPRLRESIIDPDHPNCHVSILGQWFDNLIQFDCWSKYNERSDELIDWFEDFMYKYVGVWKKNGVNEILYWMRNPDEEASKWRNDLAVRSVMYYFRTEKIVTVKEHDLRQIDLFFEVSNALPSGTYGVSGGIIPSGYMEIMDRGFMVYE